MDAPDDPTAGRPSLDTEGVLWVAAIDRVPIEDRIEWVRVMKGRIAAINAERAQRAVPDAGAET